jgi:hypothetical protein
MPAGLTIYNTSNTVQVDENYKNLAFRERRAISLSHAFGVAYVDIAITGANVVIGMQSYNYAPFLLAVSLSGTTWTYRWGFNNVTGVSSDTAYLYIFDDPPPNPDHFGLEVYNASGGLVFQSNTQGLKIVSVQGGASGYTGTSGRTYVPVIVQASIWPEFNPGLGQYTNQTYALRASGNAITSYQLPMAQGFVGYDSRGLYAAVDVTGYL